MARQKTLDWRFWMPTSLAVASLVISAGSAYFSVFRQVDRVGVVFKSTPVAFREAPDRLMLRFTDMSAAFLNSGNRSAVILSVELWVVQSKDIAHDESCSLKDIKEIAEVQTSFQTLVVKPNEVVNTSLHVTSDRVSQNLPDSKTGALAVTVSEELLKQEAIPLQICFVVQLATPRRKVLVTFPVVKYRAAFLREGQGMNKDMDERWVTNYEPYMLVDETSTVFSGIKFRDP